MAYSDKAAWEYLQAAFETCKHYVEIQVAGKDDPFRATGVMAFDDEGFIEVRLDRQITVALRADHIVAMTAV